MSNILSKPKHNDFQALSKWILPCIEGFSPVFGNFEDSEVTIMPDTEINSVTDITGVTTLIKSYAIQCYFSVAEDYKIWSVADAENSENIKEFELAQSVNEWISEQDRIGNRPIVEGLTTEKVAPASSMPNFDGVDNSGVMKLARYTIFVQVTYTGVI